MSNKDPFYIHDISPSSSDSDSTADSGQSSDASSDSETRALSVKRSPIPPTLNPPIDNTSSSPPPPLFSSASDDSESDVSDVSDEPDLLLQVPFQTPSKPSSSSSSSSSTIPASAPARLKQAAPKSSGKKFTPSRYFAPVDISLKCFHCQKVGHMSRNCPQAHILVCVLCGRNRNPRDCPDVLCRRCMGKGHQAKTCQKPYFKASQCELCGASGHYLPATHTNNSNNTSTFSSNHLSTASFCPHKHTLNDPEEIQKNLMALRRVRCMVCGQQGHLRYKPNNPNYPNNPDKPDNSPKNSV